MSNTLFSLLQAPGLGDPPATEAPSGEALTTEQVTDYRNMIRQKAADMQAAERGTQAWTDARNALRDYLTTIRARVRPETQNQLPPGVDRTAWQDFLDMLNMTEVALSREMQNLPREPKKETWWDRYKKRRAVRKKRRWEKYKAWRQKHTPKAEARRVKRSQKWQAYKKRRDIRRGKRAPDPQPDPQAQVTETPVVPGPGQAIDPATGQIIQLSTGARATAWVLGTGKPIYARPIVIGGALATAGVLAWVLLSGRGA